MYGAATRSSSTPMCLSNNSASRSSRSQGRAGQLWWQFIRGRSGREPELLGVRKAPVPPWSSRSSASLVLRAQPARSQSRRRGRAGRGAGQGGVAPARERRSPGDGDDRARCGAGLGGGGGAPPATQERQPIAWVPGGSGTLNISTRCAVHQVPVVLKGIVTAEDARLRRTWIQRHRRVESRRPIDGLWSVDARKRSRSSRR
jgi:hypothetical protein